MSSGLGRYLCLVPLVSVFAVSAGCRGAGGSPTIPSGVQPSMEAMSASPSGGNAEPLVEAAGSQPPGGAGMANSVPTASPDSNVIEVTVNVHGAPPDSDLYFQIAHDAYLGAVGARGDGVCNRVAQFGFPNPPLHAGGDAGIIHTSPGGAGSTHIRFDLAHGTAAGAYEPGARIDQMFRVVDLSRTFELRSACMTMTWR